MQSHDILAKNLRMLRAGAGLSQEDLADLAQVDRTYIGGLERSVRNPTLAVIERIARALGVEPYELLRPGRE
ncbi:helix-turn-helix domain-containing protein [Lacibacterium aquatile]|uniref:Helix-turn-helix domain-containing protein n=1 Tax=Lacibacterium aquatile TaxID=1168082 RepID=A0ABW5DLE9_9PROT